VTLLLITGGRDFCEAVTTSGEPRDRDLYMAERVALGFALDMIGPDEVVIRGDEKGACRWAGIWAHRRSVKWGTLGCPDAAIVFPGGYRPDLPTYDVTVR